MNLSPHQPPRRQVRRTDMVVSQARRRPHWAARLGGGLAVVVALLVIGWHFRVQSLFNRVEASTKATSPQLGQQLAAIFKANPQVQVGVAVINLGSGTTQTYGQTTPMVAASTTKLITAADFLHQVEAGRYTLSQPLGAGTAGWQLEELVNQSDDDSWDLFNNLLGGTQLDTYASQIGLSSYRFATNTITPADEATLLQRLYEGKLLDPTDTKLLLSYMQHTNDESLIPAALPAGATVHHKYGELLDDSGNYVNDAAIISYHGKSFVLTIYTDRSDLLDITTRQQIIHEITADVVQAES